MAKEKTVKETQDAVVSLEACNLNDSCRSITQIFNWTETIVKMYFKLAVKGSVK